VSGRVPRATPSDVSWQVGLPLASTEKDAVVKVELFVLYHNEIFLKFCQTFFFQIKYLNICKK